MSSPRVLIVDDDDSAVKLLQMILELDKLTVLTTTDPYEALELARRENPDIALLDIMMPKMDGFTLCKKIREYPQLAMLPVFFVTAYSAIDLQEKMQESGADGVINKPINSQKIRELVHKYSF